MSHSRQQSRSMDVDLQGTQGSWNKAKSWATESRPVSRHIEEPPLFFTPSYLKHSRYLQRLRRSHDVKVARWKEQTRLASAGTDPATLSTSPSHSSLNKSTSTTQYRSPALQDVVETSAPDISDDDHSLGIPDRWSEKDRMNGLEILAEGNEVRFSGVTKTSDDAASILSDFPMPKECGLFYFEVTVLSKGKDGLIGVGFSSKAASLSRLPGWEKESWAYHGDDGNSFACTSGGKPYGPGFSSKDVIGCGLNFRTGTAFFTKNGVNLGDAFSGIKTERLYPSVGMKKPGEHLRVNFGRHPFLFDIDQVMENERRTVMALISSTNPRDLHVQVSEDDLIHKLVVQYLEYEGYVETAKAYARDLREQQQSLHRQSDLSDAIGSEDDVHAGNRQKIRKAILDGDIDRALKYTVHYYPRVLKAERNKDVYFRLRCRKFIEMMRQYSDLTTGVVSTITSRKLESPASNGHGLHHRHHEDDSMLVGDTQMELDEQLHRETSKGVDLPYVEDVDMDSSAELPSKLPPMIQESNLLNAAVAYGQELQHEFGNDPRPQIKRQLQDLFAIIAYPNPIESPIGPLLDPQRRVQIAEELNGAILKSLGKPSSTAIEKTCAQTEMYLDKIAAKIGGSAAFVNVHHDFLQDA